MPLLERWTAPTKWLTPAQKTRLELAEFYEMVQREVARRFLHSAEKRQAS